MKKFARLLAPLLAASAALSPIAASAEAAWHEGQMVYAANGQRVAPIYRVNADGSVQVILEGKLTVIPAASLSVVGGKVTTSKTRAEL